MIGIMGCLYPTEEWEELDMMVDSGASNTVINQKMVRAVEAVNNYS